MQILLQASVLLSIVWLASAEMVRTFHLLIDDLLPILICLYRPAAVPRTSTNTAQYVVCNISPFRARSRAYLADLVFSAPGTASSTLVTTTPPASTMATTAFGNPMKKGRFVYAFPFKGAKRGVYVASNYGVCEGTEVQYIRQLR
jgi:hypothetical protein